jgi:[histone H3]-lysine9 N-trimethyltransferase SUV39H
MRSFMPCDPSCWNRTVSRGRALPLEIFQTPSCGLGVRSPSSILARQLIDVYLGEVITHSTLISREKAAEATATSYVYDLGWYRTKMNHTTKYHVDGKLFGSAMRFVDHSCEPNAICFTVVRNKSDRAIYDLAFFAIEDIMEGEEITIDYDPYGKLGEHDRETSKEILDEAGEEQEGRVRCRCGKDSCRRWLWRDHVKEERRRKKVV